MFGDKNLNKIEKNIAQNKEVWINIHLSLSQEIKQWVASANKQLNTGVFYNIVYGEHSIMQPHITLLICRIKQANMLGKVLDIIEKSIGDTKKLNIQFDNFSLSENKHWAFLWLKDIP